ncbi:MAG: hypothetical protein IPM96_20445 [Ignavibacteria bacterium]|nr:hypothetical protein [Ignavibacteria bacterium]
MTYFELKNFEQALSLIDSYYHFLSNDETLSDAKKKFYKNFIKIVQTLILHFTSSKKLSTINLELLMKRDFPFKEWVTSKYEELIRPVSSANIPKGSMSKAS